MDPPSLKKYGLIFAQNMHWNYSLRVFFLYDHGNWGRTSEKLMDFTLHSVRNPASRWSVKLIKPSRKPTSISTIICFKKHMASKVP